MIKKEVIERTVLVIFIAVMSLFCFEHTDKALAAVRFVMSVCFPVLLGLGMAFAVNIPMSAIERTFLKIKKGKLSDKGRKTLRAVSLNVSVLLIFAAVSFVLFLVLPELARSIGRLSGRLSDLPQRVLEKRDFVEKLSPQAAYYIYDYDKSDLADKLADWAVNGSANAVGYAVGIIKSAVAIVYYILAALIIMVSVLKEKEKISAQVKKLMAAYLPHDKCRKVLAVLEDIAKVFSDFIAGQCLEACILGSMFFITMTIFKIPYALIISSLITITALIPIFGAFIGLAVGVVLIAIDTPAKAIWFIILFFTLQQLENNLIYPRVVGGSVGLPALWTFLAVLIGGDMMGVVGMIFFIPLFSCIYSALARFSNNKAKQKGDELRL